MPSLLQWCVQLFHSPTTVNIRNGGWCIVRRGGWGGWVTLIGGGDVCMCTLAQLASSPSPFYFPHPFTPLFILLFLLFFLLVSPFSFSLVSQTHTHTVPVKHTHTLCSIPLACFYHRGLCPVIWSPLLDASSMMPLWINLRLHSSP